MHSVSRPVVLSGICLLLVAACGRQEQPPPAETSPLPVTARSPAPGGAPPSPTGPTYVLPDGWERVPPTSGLRVEQFRLPAPGAGADAELVVSHLPGTGGSIQPNIDRWIAQVKQPDGSPSQQHARIRVVPAGPHEVTVLDIAGIFDPGMMAGGSGPKPGWRLLGAIIESPHGPWFYKLTGPEATVGEWATSFYAFAESLRLP